MSFSNREITFLSFSVFKASFEEVQTILNQYVSDKNFDKEEYSDNFSILDFANPPEGGAHLPIFSLVEFDSYSNIIFFFSNYSDGLTNLVNYVRDKISSKLIEVTFSFDIEHPLYKYQVVKDNGEKRKIQLLKDTKWEFFESGNALGYETLELYQNRTTKKRFSNEDIQNYLLQEGIDIKELFSNKLRIKQAILFKRKSW